MPPIIHLIMDEEMPRVQLGLLLQHFSELDDEREPWRVMYPLREVLLLVTCATIASCDDFDDIVRWGEHHLDFPRRYGKLSLDGDVRKYLPKLHDFGKVITIRQLLHHTSGVRDQWKLSCQEPYPS